MVYTKSMQTAKVFPNGRSQAVRLPKEFRFDSDEVYVARMGSAVVLMPKTASWDVLFDSLDGFSDDFMESRDQPAQEGRDSPFDA
jgi:antitoxin VapB